MDPYQEIARVLGDRFRIVPEPPEYLRRRSIAELEQGVAEGERIWWAFPQKSGGHLYIAALRDQVSSAELFLLRLLVDAVPARQEESASAWMTHIASVLREPPEAFSAAIRIEDDIENVAVPWNWPVSLVTLRPYERGVQEVAADICKTLESLADGPDLSPFTVIDSALIVALFPHPHQERHGSDEGFGEETAKALVDGLASESFIDVRAVWSHPLRSFPEVLRVVRRMLYLTQTAEGLAPEERVLSLRGLGVYELLFAVRPQFQQAYADHVLPAAALLALGTELEQTVMVFVQCDLNVSETARKLYLHRNSLLYRIERIRDMTGYDIRRFEDAVTVWSAILFKRL
ncbi:MAG: PucR family transcriptional regulator [Bacilli bacterium]